MVLQEEGLGSFDESIQLIVMHPMARITEFDGCGVLEILCRILRAVFDKLTFAPADQQ